MPGGAAPACAGAVRLGLSGRCGHGRCAELKGRAVYQCNRCKRQVGLTAGTVFHWTKLPLTTWFLAIYHLSQSKGGMSSVELARRLGTRQPTAWLMKHKLMVAMAAREAEKPKLQGRVEIDDAYLGGQRAGGKRGRGAAGKTPFVAAVETTAERKPRRLKLTVVKGFSKKEIEALAKRDLAARQQRGQRRPVLLGGGRRCRLRPLPDGHRLGPAGRQVGRPSPGSTPRSATSRRRSPAPTITSAPSTPSATSPASPGASTGRDVATGPAMLPPSASSLHRHRAERRRITCLAQIQAG